MASTLRIIRKSPESVVLMGVRVLLAPMFKRRRASDKSLSTEQIMAMRTQKSAMLPLDHPTVKGELGLLHKGLRRWKESSTASSGETATARERVAEVITQTETAVLSLNQSFR